MKIEEMGYVEEMRQRLGLSPDDTSADKELEATPPLQRVKLISGWVLGDPMWVNSFKIYFESQGLYLTTDPCANGVLELEE
jgi:hypothetical protein